MGARVGRRSAGACAGALALAGGVALAAGCMETRRSNGEDCLKNDDCLSGICSSLVCAAAPPVTSAEPMADGGAVAETGSSPPDAEEDGGEPADAQDDGVTDADDGSANDGGSVD